MADLSSIRKILLRLFIGVTLILALGIKSYAQTVDFTHDDGICGNANIGFNATISSGNVNDYLFNWSFGDGKTDTGPNVTHGFPVQPGATRLVGGVETPYTVTLTVTNKTTGWQSTVSKDVIVRPAPIPLLIDANNPSDPFNNCPNSPTLQRPTFKITVKNNSNDQNLITNYSINWGDGSPTESYGLHLFPSTLSHTYTTLGLFKLKLTTTGTNGCVASKEYKVKNQGNPPVGITATGSTEGCAPVSFSFKVSGISKNDPETSYIFDFGDGAFKTWTQADAVANDSIISHTYTRSSCDQPGKAYTIKVTASNACSSTPATTGSITVTSKPLPGFSTKNLCEGEPVQFYNDTYFDCFNKVSYIWNFGDGTPNVISADNSEVTHTFPITNNQYTVSLTAVNSCKDTTISKLITLTRSPISDFQLSALQGCLNTTSPFVINATNKSTGDIQTLLWSVIPATGWTFSQGGANTANPQFSFTKKGNYTITLRASNGCSYNDKLTRIMVNDLVTATLFPISSQCDSYTFDASQSTTFKIDSIQNENVSAQWNIIPATGWAFVAPTTAQSIAPKIFFSTPGDYTISVVLKNGCGTITKTIPLNIKALVHLVTSASDSSGCAPKTINFVDQSTGTGLTYNWTVTPSIGFSFINSSSTSKDVSIQFTESGIYTVTHTVIGACNTQSKTFTITISAGPVITFQPITNQCDRQFKLNIDANNFKLNNNGVPLTSLKWSISPATGVTFIDGTTENSEFPHIQFSEIGKYTVSVEAINDCGKSTASQIFRVLEHAVEKARPSATVGCASLVVSFTDQSSGDLLDHNWTVSPATNWTITPSATSQSPTITFNKAGIYTVTHKISNQCGSDQHDYIIKVKELPVATLSPFPNSCNTYTFIADPQNFKVNTNQNDTISYLWTVTPNRSVSFTNNTSDTSNYPVIHIADTGIFVIKASITSTCGVTEVQQTIGITKGPEILLTQHLNNRCLPSDLTFTGSVYGQNLVYEWTVLPDNGIIYQNNTSAASPKPQIRFTQPGYYKVTLKTTNNCSTDIKSWNDTIIGQPTIIFSPIPDTCDSYTFKAERFVTVQDNGNAINSFNWTIIPNSGFTYTAGTSTSEYPHILFNTEGTYQLTLQASNDCGITPYSRSFTVDKFVQVSAGSDSTFCTSTNLIQLAGNPSGGNWRILPSSAATLVKLIGNTYYFDPSLPGIYTLIYHHGNSYCYSEASKKYTVIALPVVNAGPDFSICVNETKPYTLKGTPVGGTWSGTGITANSFSASGLAVGSYILKYSYTDPNTLCINTDQVVARVLDVPATGFNAPLQSCKDQVTTFTPFGQPNTIFNWDFGDGQTASSAGSVTHTYRTGGTFTVNLISADQNNCGVSTSKKISIQDDIIMPVVTVTPQNGCGPLSVTFTIDTTGTTGNGQKHQWDFGNGTVINDAITSKVIVYNPGMADTIYTAHLTVSNNCFTHTTDYPITVKTLPHADFSFPHPWECSPVMVKFRNIAIDRNASFFWDFDDGTTSTAFEPTHLFSTGKSSKEFKIKLVANNGCGKDSVTRILLVKPNSIEAYIEMSARLACPRDLITFRNLSTDTVSKISSFYWDFGDGTVVNTWDATHAYAAPGNYTIKLYVDNGCSKAEKTDQITILPIPTLQIASIDSICVGDTLNLAGSSNGVVLTNGLWNFGDGSSGTGLKTSHVFNTTGWHTITFTAADITSILQCTGLITKQVYVKASPPQLSLPDLTGCSPFTISIPSPGSDAYLWNFGDGNLWTGSSNHTFINNSSQPVRKKVSILAENNNACRTISFFWVTIYPNPVAKIGVRSEGGYPEKVIFKNLSTNSATCEWRFPDGSTGISCDSITYSFWSNGNSRIYLRTSNQYGCADTTSIIHQTLLKGLFVPNALQPSNADPLVKVFKPIGIGLRAYHLGIYDIWGNQIWETDKIKDTETEEGWTGQTQSGKDLPQGVYVWRITATFIDGTSWKGMKGPDNKERTEGTITLIR
jgi:PKD repeat protein